MATEPSVSRVNHILTRFACCSLAEQLQLLRTLPSLVSVDFIFFLPCLPVVRILTHLSVEEVTTCLRVSRSWYSIISDCKEYWLGVCNLVGLSNACVEYHLLKYSGSTKSVALSAWRHYRGIRTACSDCKLHIVPRLANRFYAGKGNQIVWDEQIEWCKFFTNSFELFETHYMMTGKTCVLWAHSCNTKIVLATNSASWGVLYKGGETQFWDDNVILDLVSGHVGEACNKCGLIAYITQSSHRLQFKVRLVRLHPGCSTVDAQEHACYVVNQITVTENSFLHLESSSLVSSCGNSVQSESSSCYEHYLLIQVGGTITVFGHRHNTGKDLEQLHHYCPSNNLTALTSAVFLGNSFCLSEDQCLVALTSSNRLCVWDLVNGRMLCEAVIPITGSMAYSWRCVAIGHLYAVIHNEHSSDAAIVCVSNGRPLQQFKVVRRQINVDKLLLLEQEWLNTIDPPITNNLHFMYKP